MAKTAFFKLTLPQPDPRLSRMLPESSSDPKPIPMPDNWPGVAAGLTHAIALLQETKLDEAENLLSELEDFAAADARLWYLRGKLEQKRGNEEQAQSHYRRAKRLRQQGKSSEIPSAPGSMRIAKLLHGQGDITQALTMIDTLLTSRPNDLRLLRLKNRWHSDLTQS
ncbi:MAG: hypothetical protein R8J84_02845 [Mariprofundales bacterium]